MRACVSAWRSSDVTAILFPPHPQRRLSISLTQEGRGTIPPEHPPARSALIPPHHAHPPTPPTSRSTIHSAFNLFPQWVAAGTSHYRQLATIHSAFNLFPQWVAASTSHYRQLLQWLAAGSTLIPQALIPPHHAQPPHPRPAAPQSTPLSICFPSGWRPTPHTTGSFSSGWRPAPSYHRL